MKNNLNQESPVFIVGMPRSGTTLMSSILSAHPNIAIPYSETKFISHWTHKYPNKDLNSKENFDFFWSKYTESETFSYLGLDANKVLCRISNTNSYSYEKIFACILQEYAIKMGKPRWGDKDPEAQRSIKKIIKWFPHCKIIWMLRDPRSVIASRLSTPWGKGNIIDHSLNWSDSVSLLERHINDQRIMVIKYEELVTQSENILKQVCNFIDEEYTPTMIDNRSETNSPICNRTGWASNYLKSVLKPITVTSVDKWQSDLSPSQIAIIEYTTRDKMIGNGYQPNSSYLNSAVYFFIAKAKKKMTNLRANLSSKS